MSDARQTSDLIVVVADLDAKRTVEELLGRPKSLGTRPLQFAIDRYVKRDSGCFGSSHDYLRPFVRQFDYALVIFDRHGSGKDDLPREEIESVVEQQLAANGWKDRSVAIAIDPELEAWVWSDSPEVDHILGWRGQTPNLQSWLQDHELVTPDTPKPVDPKQTFKDALREVDRKPSPAIFAQLARTVSTSRCTDPAFLKFKQTLQTWFPAT